MQNRENAPLTRGGKVLRLLLLLLLLIYLLPLPLIFSNRPDSSAKGRPAGGPAFRPGMIFGQQSQLPDKDGLVSLPTPPEQSPIIDLAAKDGKSDASSTLSYEQPPERREAATERTGYDPKKETATYLKTRSGGGVTDPEPLLARAAPFLVASSGSGRGLGSAGGSVGGGGFVGGSSGGTLAYTALPIVSP
jgi:hypothetical protein